VGRKKLVRKAEPPSKRGIAWPRWTGFRGKTVWDWMALLIVPLVLVVIGLVFTMLQDARQQQIENQRAQQAQKIENQRAEAERELALQRAQDEALQAYLSQMSSLLLDKNLRASEADSEVRTLARARTLTVLGRLDPSRKTAVMEFLIEAELVQGGEGRAPIISLMDADLSNANLHLADLRGAQLIGANLSNAFLKAADLRGADLFLADLSNAFLRKAHLSGATLDSANLNSANLIYADLRDVILFNTNLDGAKLKIEGVEGIEGITYEELEQQAYSLKGATMPNGQKYEEWLKDKKAQGKDEKNE
jgi:uncharacterized protein YjbI with pentapeptide repeats